MKWYVNLVIVIVCFILLYFCLAWAFFRLYARKRRDGLPYFKYQKLTDFKGLNEKKFSLVNRDKETLNGSVYYYDDFSHVNKFILFVHGNTQGHIQLIHLFNKFAEKGYGVIAYSMEGCGLSTGKKIKCFTRGLYDYQDVCSYLSSCSWLKGKDIYLMGHSWGGFIVCNNIVSNALPFKAVVSFSSFNSELKMLNQLAKVSVVFYPLYRLVYSFLYPDIYKCSSLDSLGKSDIPTLLIHGNKDQVISYEKNFMVYKKRLSVKKNINFISRRTGHVSFLKPLDSLYMDKFQKDLSIYSYFLYLKPIRKKAEKYAETLDYSRANNIDSKLIDEVVYFLNNLSIKTYKETSK